MLAEKKTIPISLGESLVRATRLRNILVHRYWDVDDKKVYQSAKEEISDFKEFAELILKVIKKWRD